MKAECKINCRHQHEKKTTKKKFFALKNKKATEKRPLYPFLFTSTPFQATHYHYRLPLQIYSQKKKKNAVRSVELAKILPEVERITEED